MSTTDTPAAEARTYLAARIARGYGNQDGKPRPDRAAPRRVRLRAGTPSWRTAGNSAHRPPPAGPGTDAGSAGRAGLEQNR